MGYISFYYSQNEANISSVRADFGTLTRTTSSMTLTALQYPTTGYYRNSSSETVTSMKRSVYRFNMNAALDTSKLHIFYMDNGREDATCTDITDTVTIERLTSTVFNLKIENIATYGSQNIRLLVYPNYSGGKEYTYTVDGLTNCTCNKQTGDIVNVGDSITITANEGYEFSDNYYYFIQGSSNKYFDISEDKKILSYEVVTDDDISISSIEAKEIPPTNYTYTVEGLTNCTCNKQTGDIVNVDDSIVITAENGYQFNATTYTYKTGNLVRPLSVSDDKSQLTSTVGSYQGNIVIQGITATLIPVVTTSAFLHIYDVKNSELESLSKKRFYNLEDGTPLDYGTNIIKLYRSYLNISDDVKSSGTIQLGRYNSTVKSTELNDNIIKVSLSINTDGMINENTYQCELYIPNKETTISIESYHVFNKELKIELSYDLYSGMCQYSLYDNGILFDSGTFEFSSDIPFRSYDDNVSQYNYNYNPPLSLHCSLIVYGSLIITPINSNINYISGDLIEFSNENISDSDLDEVTNLVIGGFYINP